MDEAALHRGTYPAVLRDELDALVARSLWPNVELRVLPFEAGFSSANGTFALFEPRDASDREVVNVESTGQVAYVVRREVEGDMGAACTRPRALRRTRRSAGRA